MAVEAYTELLVAIVDAKVHDDTAWKFMFGDFLGKPIRGPRMLTAEAGQMGVNLQPLQYFVLENHIRHERRNIRHIVAHRILIEFGLENSLPGEVALRLKFFSRITEREFRAEALQ